MESIFTNPAGLKDMFRMGMKQEAEEGGMTDEELQGMVEATEIPPPGKGKGKGKRGDDLELRGEGGSGEKPGHPRTPTPEEVSPVSDDVFSPASEDLQEGGEDEAGAGGDVEAHQGDMSSQVYTSTHSGGEDWREEVYSLRALVEEQFAGLNSIIQPMLARIEALERKASVRIPGPIGTTSPPPSKHRSRPSVEEEATEGKGKGKLIEREVFIDPEKVRQFIRSNPKFPSLRPVRIAKLKTLQLGLGLNPKVFDLKVSEWAIDPLYAKLLSIHQG